MARQPIVHSEQAVVAILAASVKRSGSANRWGRKHGFSSAFVREVLAGTKPVSPRLLAALGLQRRVEIVRVEEPRS